MCLLHFWFNFTNPSLVWILLRSPCELSLYCLRLEECQLRQKDLDLQRVVNDQQTCLFLEPVNKQNKKPKLWKTMIMISAISISICCLYSHKSVLCCSKYNFQIIFLLPLKVLIQSEEVGSRKHFPSQKLNLHLFWNIFLRPKHVGL